MSRSNTIRKQAHRMTEKNQSLYELEEETEQLAQEEATPNGNTPAEVEYLDTADEDELRALISNISDVVEELVPIPEWQVNGKVVRVLVRALTARERSQFIQNMQKVNFDLVRLYPDLAIMTARHPTTKKLIWKPADRDMLNTKIGRSLERIAMKASDISGLSEDFLNDMKKN